MTAAPSRHGHKTPDEGSPENGGLPPTITPLHAPPHADLPAEIPPPDLPIARNRAGRWRGPIVTGAVMTAIWALLLGDQPESWLMGAPAILGGVALAATVPGAVTAATGPRQRLSPRGMAVFGVWFARASVLGAMDVAWRASQPRPAIAPGFRGYTTDLPPGSARTLFSNCITLLPGTLTADIDGARLTIHMLDRNQDLEADLGALEARVAAIWTQHRDEGNAP